MTGSGLVSRVAPVQTRCVTAGPVRTRYPQPGACLNAFSQQQARVTVLVNAADHLAILHDLVVRPISECGGTKDGGALGANHQAGFWVPDYREAVVNETWTIDGSE